MQKKRKIVILGIVALVLLAMVGPFVFLRVRKQVRLRRGRKAFAARQQAARRAAGRQFLAAHANARQYALAHDNNDPDSKVVLKSEHPESLQDEKKLSGRTLWVDAGGQLDYYRYTGRSIDFSHSEGVLLGAQKILVKDAVQQPVPETAGFAIPRGDAQILLLFTFPDEPRSASREFAVAVGDKEDGAYNLLTDQIMFYDDPHQLYAYWGPEVWRAIDEHRVILGMTERQVLLALGQVRMPRGDMMGDRLVEFDNLGHPILVTFGFGKGKRLPLEVDKVTKIVDETQ